MLDAFDVTAQMLNPNGVSIDELRADGATLAPPNGCPVSALTPDTLPPLLVDIASPTIRLRCMIDEVIADKYVGPHLAKVESRDPGIFYSALSIIGMHQDIADIFGNADCPWDMANVGVLNLEFALGLQVVMMHAAACGLDKEAHVFVDESMKSYGAYHREQTRELWENPGFRIGALGSPEADPRCEDHGVWHARFLVEEGQAELLRAVARFVSEAGLDATAIHHHHHSRSLICHRLSHCRSFTAPSRLSPIASSALTTGGH
jgi:hypothetical protein